jgi:murein DD-endopeptidase MepM/ murein hydrolase activator NlpD
MNARYYLPEGGRFISPDTLVPDPGNPQSFNRYSYVRNNPVNLTDPTGHREIGANENDLLPHEALLPRLSEMLSAGPEFHGLPVENVTWAQGYGATKYAAKYGGPSSKSYNNLSPTYRNSAGLHAGIDLGVSANTNVYSNVLGVLKVPPPFPKDAGPNVIIELENGMLVVYGHVNLSIGLTDGMEISPGMLIGTVADQGPNSHVHLSLREGSRTYNPAYFFSDASEISTLPYSGYVAGESLYSISSFLYQPSRNANNYWENGARSVGVWR